MHRTPHHHAGPATSHHLAPWHRRSVYGVGALLVATGVVWLGLHYLVGAGTGDLPHPLEAWSLRLHGLAAFAGLFVLGVVAAAHVPHGWRLSRRHRWAHQRRTGLLLGTLAGALAASGYLLYYFAPESVRPFLGGLHAAIGLAMVAALALHRRRF